MKFSTKAIVGAAMLSTAVVAQDSFCDKYTKALFTDNTAANQYTLLVKVVNTALIGNYTPGAKNLVSGILVPGVVNGKNVNLLPYFNGGFVSTNTGSKAASVNFIDDGAAFALANDMPATGTSSRQYRLVSGLYSYFGSLLNCSMYNTTGFPGYAGPGDMYELHKYMNIDINEITYFVDQVAAAATSFGVSSADIAPIGAALMSLFGMRCAPAAVVIPAQPADLQAICINSDCPQATSAACSNYNRRAGGAGVDPATATSTPGPQLTALAAELSTIDASVISESKVSYTQSTFVTTISGAAVTSVVAVPIAGGAFLTTGVVTISSGSSVETSSYTSTVTGQGNGGAAGGIVVSTGTTTETTTFTSSSSTFTSVETSTFTTTGSLSEMVTSEATTETSGSSTITTSVAMTETTLVPITVNVETSVITSGSSTITTVFSSTAVVTGGAGGGGAGGAGGSAASTSTSKAAGVPLKVQGGIFAVAGMAAAAMY